MPAHQVELTPPTDQDCSSRWWLEWELALLCLLVAVCYLIPLDWLVVRGEEPRRAQVAREMIASGDWIVPRYQGTLFLSRPPLQNWLLAGLGLLRGDVDPVAIRLPSVIAVWLTSLLVYAYGRRFLSRLGSLTAAAGFLTMGQVLELGRSGETEALFTLLVAGSLLVWHAGAARGRISTATWLAAYALVALGVLTKGPQAPVYFAGSVGTYLLLTGRWREAFSLGHLAGIALSLVLWGAWQGAYLAAEGWEATRRMYWDDVAMRFEDSSWANFAEHLVTYPFELLACTLPWSGLLAAYLFPAVRRSLGTARREALFLIVCLAVTFPTCWLVQGAKGRYYMPLYPCLALLVGLYVERMVQEVALRKPWRAFSDTLTVILAASGLALAAFPLVSQRLFELAFPAWAGLLLGCGAWSAAWLVHRGRQGADGRRVEAAVASLASFLAILYGTFVVTLTAADATRTDLEVARLRAQLPADARLVSYGMVDPMFLYYFNRPIEYRSRKPEDVQRDTAEYFCLSSAWGNPPPESLRFAWEPVAVVSCERSIKDDPQRVVRIGRRVAAVADGKRVISH
ncbi:MAG: glycosyltransferase family 39 protein [Pirellulaceae bacterium]|nr:glycosyltransferase family 39 protein [Pirellulaceae bacterium]